jgi:hypothetical protein
MTRRFGRLPFGRFSRMRRHFVLRGAGDVSSSRNSVHVRTGNDHISIVGSTMEVSRLPMATAAPVSTFTRGQSSTDRRFFGGAQIPRNGFAQRRSKANDRYSCGSRCQRGPVYTHRLPCIPSGLRGRPPRRNTRYCGSMVFARINVLGNVLQLPDTTFPTKSPTDR